MCGRYAYLTSWSNINFYTGAEVSSDTLPQRYNLPPTQKAPVVRINSEGKKVGEMLSWGLIPSWSKDTKYAASCANARSETVAEKPSFRSAFQKNRCLVPVSGYYEWKVLGDGKKQPYYIYSKEKDLFFLAGLWECWDRSKIGQSGLLETFTIITTEANTYIKSIHDRMPVILQQKDFEIWLNPEADIKTVNSLLKPVAENFLFAHKVSTLVNKPANDSNKCIENLELS